MDQFFFFQNSIKYFDESGIILRAVVVSEAIGGGRLLAHLNKVDFQEGKKWLFF